MVENKYGPLNRTNVNHEGAGAEGKRVNGDSKDNLNVSFGLEKRIQNIEDHLGVGRDGATSQFKELFVRVKNIEDFLIEVEEKVPEIARTYFQAHKEPLATRMKPSDVPEDTVKILRAADGSETSDEDSEEAELKESEINRRIEELKKNLMSNS